MTVFAETERLLLREIVSGDAPGMFELDSDPEVHRYLGRKPVTHIDQAHQAIDYIRGQYKEHGIGRWAVIDKQTGDFMGWAGLKLMTTKANGYINFHDLGYRLIRRYWGRGFATEAARASLDYGFTNLNLPEIFGMADCLNLASCHVLQKAGLRFVNKFMYDGDEHNWYGLNREEWQKMPRR